MGVLLPEATSEQKGLMPPSMTRLYGKNTQFNSGQFIKVVNINNDYKFSLIRINISPTNNYATEDMMSIVIIAASEVGTQKYRAVKMGNTTLASLYYNEEGLFIKNNYRYGSIVFIELAATSSDNIVGELLSEAPTGITEII